MTPEIKREAPVRRGAEIEPAHFFCTSCRCVSLAPWTHGAIATSPRCKNDACPGQWWNWSAGKFIENTIKGLQACAEYRLETEKYGGAK